MPRVPIGIGWQFRGGKQQWGKRRAGRRAGWGWRRSPSPRGPDHEPGRGGGRCGSVGLTHHPRHDLLADGRRLVGIQQRAGRLHARIALQNAEGGIDGHKINGVVLDDQTSPTEIATAVQDAVSKNPAGIVSVSPLFFLADKYPQQAACP